MTRLRDYGDTLLNPQRHSFSVLLAGHCFAAPTLAEAFSALRAAETIGRPLGSASFLDRLADATGRDPRPRPRGPRPRVEAMGAE